MSSTVPVTVLMPAYNAGKYIGEAIDSVLRQTFTDFELLIINDGSTDDTAARIKKFDDKRIKVAEQNHSGVAAALNHGLNLAAGKYIARFDADDICLPDRLMTQVNFLDKNPGYILTGCEGEYISEEGHHLFHFKCPAYTHEEILSYLYFYCPFIHSGVLYRKEPVLRCGGYSEFAHNFEDYLLWTQLAKHGRFYNLPESLIKVRFNPASVTIDEKWRGKKFRKLKREIIHRGFATETDSNKLMAIIQNQNTARLKNAAYHALCGKKFLVDNYNPGKARNFLAKAIKIMPERIDNFFLYGLSFFPKSFIDWLHLKSPNRL